MKVKMTMGGVTVEREEQTIHLQCFGCSKTATGTLTEITPPGGIGTTAYWRLMPKGWWDKPSMGSMFTSKSKPSGAFCGDCLQPLGATDVEEDS